MPKGIPRDTSVKHTLLHRLKIVRGHLNRVINMVENDRYCIDVIHQSIAIRAALNKIDRIIMKNHMQTCVAEAISQGKKDEVIDEVMKVMEKQSS